MVEYFLMDLRYFFSTSSSSILLFIGCYFVDKLRFTRSTLNINNKLFEMCENKSKCNHENTTPD